MKKKNKEIDDLVLDRGGIDTHAHLDLDPFDKDLKEVIERASAKGVTYIVNVFLNPESYILKRDIFLAFKKIYFTLGIHPHEADKVTPDTIDKMKDLFKKDMRLRAIGEIGLDFYRNYCDREVQIKGFKMQLELAKDMDLPVVIHSRDAEEETLRILKDMGFKDHSLLWHCFTKGMDLAEKILKMGWMVSIPGPVTFKNAKDLQVAVANIPLESMVVETDCPFLTPHPFRGKRNEPSYVVYTARKIAEIKKISLPKAWEELSLNGKKFFKIAY
jgi:TatD DNase family protein